MLLQKFIEEVKALSHDEQRELRKILDEILAQQEETEKINAFHKALLTSGLVKTVKTPRSTTAADRRLIHVKGKPLSATIIEDRR